MPDFSLLVVEDEQTLRRLLEYRLSKHYDVRTAANGQEALDLVAEMPPDLIVSDIMMPQLDGFALQSALQEDKETRAIPFIFLTAKADEESQTRGRRTGVDDYITKPFDIEQLMSRIERLLERTALYRTQLDSRLGRDFSSKLMPKRLPEVGGYRLFFYSQPHDHGGGDLFDWREARPGVYFITVGDVMGKGLQAKFYAFSFLSYLRSTLRGMLRESGASDSPAELMHRINELLVEDEVMEETFASLLLMRWEPAEHRITYANAGHCRPALVRPDGASIVEYSDLILGLEPGASFEDTALTLPEGGGLLAYTDGLIEQPRLDGKMMGEENMLEIAGQAYAEDDPIDAVLGGTLARSSEDAFDDDMLLFWIQRTDQPAHSVIK